MAEVLEPVKFSLEIEGTSSDLIIPEEFIRDFHFSTPEHLMIIIRVIGKDALKVRDFFEDTKGEIFGLKTVEADPKKEISGKFLLEDIHMDDGYPLGVDIDQEQAMVRLILDFKAE